MIEVSGEDLHKQLLHINRNLRKGSKLMIEVYENMMLLVYKDMEYPVRVINPIINWGNGEYEIVVNSDKDLEYIMSLVKQVL